MEEEYDTLQSFDERFDEEIEDLIDNDEISAEEAGFMKGSQLW